MIDHSRINEHNCNIIYTYWLNRNYLSGRINE